MGQSGDGSERCSCALIAGPHRRTPTCMGQPEPRRARWSVGEWAGSRTVTADSWFIDEGGALVLTNDDGTLAGSLVKAYAPHAWYRIEPATEEATRGD